MAGNLRDRLKMIQGRKSAPAAERSSACADSERISALESFGWESCGFQTLKRVIIADSPFRAKGRLPPALAIVVPDLAGRKLPKIEDFLFFDLETTGLSGGAGTVAFLAAFGRMVSGKLHITQYLLLDYPGENDFLEASLSQFKNENSVIVTYNGKSFDSQILKTRCLMNGIKPPEYYHADLLHPARRLWKNVIGDCSQGSIETRILGLDRSGDIPGALAPEIWFEFLKTGKHERLMGICDHNISDITGLSSILSAMISIAAAPFDSQYHYDLERLALYWRDFVRFEESSDLQRAGGRLLHLAVQQKYPRACYVYASDQLRGGREDEGRKGLLDISESDFPQNIKAAALRALAIDSERRLKDSAEALMFAKQGLAFVPEGAWHLEFERRVQRLERKETTNNTNKRE